MAFWSPHYQTLVESSEIVQIRFARMLPGVESFRHEGRLDKLGLFSLERRRLMGDQIEVCKIMRDVERLDSQRLFPRMEGFSTFR